ncbi:MAG TPA: arginine repressor [Myxococcaceae bacterium]|nr:arginine repressor [Myxococcaceae bacterium]
MAREMMRNDHDTRRAAIRALIRSRRVGTQEELRQLLASQGYDVTQATLSRDLARLGARRVSLPEGGTAYEVEEARFGGGSELLVHYREMVTTVVEAEALVVVQTLPGSASAVARAVDQARVAQVAGTIAGDDTIFIALSRGVSPARVARQLRALWLKGRAP